MSSSLPEPAGTPSPRCPCPLHPCMQHRHTHRTRTDTRTSTCHPVGTLFLQHIKQLNTLVELWFTSFSPSPFWHSPVCWHSLGGTQQSHLRLVAQPSVPSAPQLSKGAARSRARLCLQPPRDTPEGGGRKAAEAPLVVPTATSRPAWSSQRLLGLSSHLPERLRGREGKANSPRSTPDGKGRGWGCLSQGAVWPCQASATREKGGGTEEGGEGVLGRGSLTLAQLFSWLIRASLSSVVQPAVMAGLLPTGSSTGGGRDKVKQRRGQRS